MLKKIGFAVAGLSLIASPLLASADTLSDLQAQVESLLVQIKTLQQSTVAASSSLDATVARPSLVCPQILRSLSRGSRGDDVTKLQAYLGVSQTGYFGPLTAAAVAKFQASEGLSQVGIVGPLTRAAFARRCGYTQSDRFSASPMRGVAPLAVNFTYAPKIDDSGQYYIEFGDGEGQLMDLNQIYCIRAPCISPSVASHTYTSAGTYTASVSRYIACLYSNPRCLMAQPAPLATLVITVTSSSTTDAPSISGVEGPTQLSVGQNGTWSVRVTDSSGYLSYSVRWGDEAAAVPAYGTAASAHISSSGTFTHTYATAGTYSPTFTVTNGNGKSASASATVVVGGTTNQTFSASPTSGNAPLMVSFSYEERLGSGNEYIVDFGDGSSAMMRDITTYGCAGFNQCPGAWASSHTYTSAGTYTAKLYGSPCPPPPLPGTTNTFSNTHCGMLGTATITVY